MGKESERSRPLVPLRSIWDKDSLSKYPDVLKIPMDDGKVISYRIDVEQPHPAFLFVMDKLSQLPEGSYTQKKTGTCDGRHRRGRK